MTILELLIVLLTIGFFLLLILPSTVSRFIATGVSLLGLLLGLYASFTFDKSLPGFQEISVYEVLPTYNLTLSLGVDGLSILFLLLTLFVFPVCFLAAWSASKLFLLYVFSMELLLVLTFSTLDLFFFFVFFESLLIPMFLLIGLYGARDRKIKAAYFFFLYTLFGSLFMLFGILYLYEIAGTTNYEILLATPLTPFQQGVIWCCFFLAFAVKMPLFPLHIWLPEAHVEAPTVGSMLLASLLLKLGGYGFIRFSLALLPTASTYFGPLVSTCALLGVLYGSLVTLRQIDMKRVIAYSSVAHMNLVVLGLFSGTQQGLEGAIYLMLGHGVVSTALFFCVGVLYDRYHSRMIRYYTGLVLVMPLFVTAFFLFTLANMSFPGTPNFLGELLIFLGVFEQNLPILLFATSGIVLAAVYSVWLFNRIAFGTLKREFISDFSDLSRREAVIFLTLIFPMVFFGLYAGYLLDFLHLPVKELLHRTVEVNAECRPSTMFLLLTFVPLLNVILIVLSSRILSQKQTHVLLFASMFTSLFALAASYADMVKGMIYHTTIESWMVSGLFDVQWTFTVDSLTYVMLLVVLTVSTLVHLYATEYMSEDPHLPRFLSYLSLFTFFMLLLVTSENLVSLFLGWEGVGLCSYLLITFWYARLAANKAAIKAMIVNRIADLAFTIGILCTFYTFRSVEFSVMFGLAPYAHLSAVSTITLLLFIGAMGKSAQIGLHTWLPDAMEGPTPVSALIHAATMVTAGVFLIIRCSPLFEGTPHVLVIITLVGAATAFMAATSGLMQNDLKKIIAYSTCSQLGYMVFICGLSGYSISFFHLTNHAFFKALLFLSAGAIIHAVSGEQDLRRLGAFLNILPYTYVMFVIGSLALMGFPFLTGFYSKDLILEIAASSFSIPGTFAYWLGLITAFFTAFYSFRLLYLAFYSASRSPRAYLVHVHELTPRMAFALAVLSIGSIFFGYMARDLFIGLGTTFWNGVIVTSPLAQLSGEFLPVYIKMAPFFGSIIAVLAVFYLNVTYHSKVARGLHRFLSHKWYFDTVYNHFVNQPLLQTAYHSVFKPIDKGILEAVGPRALYRYAHYLALRVTREQTGKVYDYAWIFLFILYATLYAHESLFAIMFTPHCLYRTGLVGMDHLFVWLRRSTLRLTLIVLAMFLVPPTIVGVIGAVKYWYAFPEVQWAVQQNGSLKGLGEAFYYSSGLLFYWLLAMVSMGILTALREHIKGRSYTVFFISYTLSFAYIVLFYWYMIHAFLAYCSNQETSRLLNDWPHLLARVKTTRQQMRKAVQDQILNSDEIEIANKIMNSVAMKRPAENWVAVDSDYHEVIGPMLHHNMIIILVPLFCLLVYFPVRAVAWSRFPHRVVVTWIYFVWGLALYSLFPRFAELYSYLIVGHPNKAYEQKQYLARFQTRLEQWSSIDSIITKGRERRRERDRRRSERRAASPGRWIDRIWTAWRLN